MSGRLHNPRAKVQREIARTTRALFVERFPSCFAGQGKPKRPLKIGIAQELVAAFPDTPARHIKIALNDYCGGATYLAAMVEGAPRVALDGSEAGAVTAEEAKRAAGRLANVLEWRKRAAERRAARQAVIHPGDPGNVPCDMEPAA